MVKEMLPANQCTETVPGPIVVGLHALAPTLLGITANPSGRRVDLW